MYACGWMRGIYVVVDIAHRALRLDDGQVQAMLSYGLLCVNWKHYSLVEVVVKEEEEVYS